METSPLAESEESPAPGGAEAEVCEGAAAVAPPSPAEGEDRPQPSEQGTAEERRRAALEPELFGQWPLALEEQQRAGAEQEGRSREEPRGPKFRACHVTLVGASV